MGEMTAVQGQHRGRSRRHSQPLDADVLGLAYGVAKVVHALDLDQRGVVHIAVLVFAIADNQERVERGAAIGGRYMDLQSGHAPDDRLEGISGPFPAVIEFEFQHVLVDVGLQGGGTLPRGPRHQCNRP